MLADAATALLGGTDDMVSAISTTSRRSATDSSA